MDILDGGDSTGDGEYWIGNAFKAYCDIKTDGGKQWITPRECILYEPGRSGDLFTNIPRDFLYGQHKYVSYQNRKIVGNVQRSPAYRSKSLAFHKSI